MHLRPLRTTACALLGVSACGGGLPVDVASVVPSRIEAFPEDGVFVISGDMVVRYILNDGAGNSLGAPESQFVDFRISNESGTTTSIESSLFSMSTDEGDAILQEGSYVVSQATGEETLLILVNPNGSTSAYQLFGVGYHDPRSDATSAFAVSVGWPTDPSAMDAIVATYSGEVIGFMVDTAGDGYLTKSNFEAQTNFSTVRLAVSQSFKSPLAGGETRSEPLLDFESDDLSVVDGRFEGSSDAADITRSISGTFYGPQADEVGGVISSEGAGFSYLAGFGTKR